VAKVNPVKLKQEAEKLEKAGRPDQAIALYKQIADDNPRDWNVINKIGDLYAKLNRTREAADEYAKVADFYARDGFLLKAIAIWKKINKLDAASLEPYQQLAELYAKQGLMMEAKAQYQIVIDEFIKRGKAREAGEVLRKMAEVDPADLKVRSKLADLYTREGSTERAVGEHIAIAEELNKKGHLAEALQVLEKGLKIDPKSDRLRLELARVHLIQKNYDKAAQHLEDAVQHSHRDPQLLARLGEAYLGGKKIEEAEAIFKRLLEINPGDDEARAQMGRVYLLQDRFDEAYQELQPAVERLLGRRESEKAAALLQQITQRNAQHVETLHKLAGIYRDARKESSLAAALSQLTEALIAHRDFAQAATVLEELVQREPQNQQHRSKLDFVRTRLGGAAPARSGPAAPPTSDLDFEDEDFDLSLNQPEAAPAPRGTPRAAPPPPPPAPKRPRVEASGPLSDEDREFIEEHVAEGRVFRKYGLVDKAADQFDSVVARFPDNLEARIELRDLHRDRGQAAKAADHCLALADIYRMRGDEASAVAQEEEARRLVPAAEAPAPAPAPAPAVPRPAAAPAPEAKAAAAPKAATPAKAAAKPAPPPLPEPEPEPDEESVSFGLEDDEEIALDHGGEEVALSIEEDEEIAMDEAPAAPAPPAPARAAAPPDPSLIEFDEEGADELSGGFLEEETVLEEQEPEPEPEPAAPAIASEGDFSSFDEELGGGLVEEEAPVPEPEPEPAFDVSDMDLNLDEPEPVPEAEPEHELVFSADEEDEMAAGAFEESLASEPVAEPEEVLETSAGALGDLGLDLDDDVPIELAEEPAPVEREPEPPPRVVTPPPAPARAKPAPAPPPPAAPAAPAGLLKVLDEVDQYMALGFVDDARDALRELTAKHPDHPAILAKLAELGLDLDLAEEPPAMSAGELADELLGGELDMDIDVSVPLAPEPEEPSFAAADDAVDFSSVVEEEEEEPAPAEEPEAESVLIGADEPDALDLAAELDGLFSPQPAVEEPEPVLPMSSDLDSGLAEIFKEFKKGVDKQLGQEDYDTRYNLGIAYKEMGLIDEAIAEFQLAAKDERRLLECASMLGICFLEKGMPKLAIKWFEKGLRAPGRSDEEYQGLRYDLATAHEAAGDLTQARTLFTELFGQDATFRDVASKVRELGSPR
jgi:pilus assembly protein FimV